MIMNVNTIGDCSVSIHITNMYESYSQKKAQFMTTANESNT